MLERKQLYSLGYYKKNTFYGSIGQMNFRVKKEEQEPVEEITQETSNEETKPCYCIEAICWPGPYIYSKTAEEDKRTKQFAYSEEGLVQVTKWLNEQHDLLYGKE